MAGGAGRGPGRGHRGREVARGCGAAGESKPGAGNKGNAHRTQGVGPTAAKLSSCTTNLLVAHLPWPQSSPTLHLPPGPLGFLRQPARRGRWAGGRCVGARPVPGAPARPHLPAAPGPAQRTLAICWMLRCLFCSLISACGPAQSGPVRRGPLPACPAKRDRRVAAARTSLSAVKSQRCLCVELLKFMPPMPTAQLIVAHSQPFERLASAALEWRGAAMQRA